MFISLLDQEQNDFVSLSAFISFPSGAPAGTVQCVCVSILDDNILESTETFTLQLISSSPDVVVEDGVAVVSINDTGMDTYKHGS